MRDRGFESDGVIVAQFWNLEPSLTGPAMKDALIRAVDAVAAQPGIVSVAASSGVPFGVAEMTTLTSDLNRVGVRALVNEISDDYFRVLNIPAAVRISAMCAQDEVILSKTLSTRLLGAASPVGRSVYVGSALKPTRVYGTVPDTEDMSRLSPGQVYMRLSGDSQVMRLMVKHAGSGADVTPTVMQAIASELPWATVVQVSSLEYSLDQATGRLRMVSWLAGVLALSARIIGITAVSSAVDDAIRSQWRSLAIRIALGASVLRAAYGAVRPLVLCAAGGVGIAACAWAFSGGQLYRWMVISHTASGFLVTSAIFGMCTVLCATVSAASWRVRRINPARVLAGKG